MGPVRAENVPGARTVLVTRADAGDLTNASPYKALGDRKSLDSERMMLILQDWVFFLGHVILILFNMFGWIWKKTRVPHLITIGVTAFSWFVLGAMYGWGYCFCTDYHARILRQLGHPDADVTFIQLGFKRLFGISLDRPLADNLAIVTFALILVATAVVWARDAAMSNRREKEC